VADKIDAFYGGRTASCKLEGHVISNSAYNTQTAYVHRTRAVGEIWDRQFPSHDNGAAVEEFDAVADREVAIPLYAACCHDQSTTC